jgi:Cu(I)/Ag(I) efflux system membrane protein CusA/SilA
LVSSTILTLVVIPAVYGLVKGWRLPKSTVAKEAVLEPEPTDLEVATK